MANSTPRTPIYANNLTITTGLTGCDQTVNISKTIEDLFEYYQSNQTNPVFSEFSNVTITDIDCNSKSQKYFNHMITLAKSASIEVQIKFASAYYEFIRYNSYFFNGFYIETEPTTRPFNLSSITLNNTARSDACSSAFTAQESLCAQNSTTPVCTVTSNNPWNFKCSTYTTTSTVPTADETNVFTTTSRPFLEPWQIGLVAGISLLFLLMIVMLIVYYLRRHFRRKRMAFFNEKLFDDVKLVKKNGISRNQTFKNSPTIVQPIRNPTVKTPWIHTTTKTKLNSKPAPMPINRGTFKDHTKIHPRVANNNIPKKTIYIPNNHSNNIVPKVYQSTAIPRPVSGTSANQLRLITDGLEENVLDKSDNISLDPSNSTSPKKPSTPVSRQSANQSFVDESLHDEDAWMSILAVVNAELDVLNRLENEQNHLRTIM